jgi:hypothetical protein
MTVKPYRNINKHTQLINILIFFYSNLLLVHDNTGQIKNVEILNDLVDAVGHTKHCYVYMLKYSIFDACITLMYL